MQSLSIRRLFAVMLIAASAFTFCACERSVPELPSGESDGLNIEILNTGKSDCIIIRMDGEVIVIDTADTDDGGYISDRLQAYGISEIDHLILTHYDKDHIGSAAELIGKFDVGRIIAPDFSDTSEFYAILMNAISSTGTEIVRPDEDMFFDVGGGSIWINVPSEASYKDENNYSLITTLTYGTKAFVFMGDALKARTQEYCERMVTRTDEVDSTDYALIKLPHHGDYYKALLELLSLTHPNYAVVTANSREIETKQNDATLEEKLIEALETLDIELYVTCDGSVKLFCDGTDVTITQ